MLTISSGLKGYGSNYCPNRAQCYKCQPDDTDGSVGLGLGGDSIKPMGSESSPINTTSASPHHVATPCTFRFHFLQQEPEGWTNCESYLTVFVV